MAPPANKHLADAERKLTFLLQEIRQTPTFERVKLYVAKMVGGKMLSAYLPDESIPVKERAALATTLIDLLLTKDYSRLPELPTMENGNTPPSSVKPEFSPAALRPDAPTPSEDPFTPEQREELTKIVRAQVRRELADVLFTVAKVLGG